MDHRIRNLILATFVIIGISIDQTLANEKHHSIAEQAQSSALPAEKMALAIPAFTLQINALNRPENIAVNSPIDLNLNIQSYTNLNPGSKFCVEFPMPSIHVKNHNHALWAPLVSEATQQGNGDLEDRDEVNIGFEYIGNSNTTWSAVEIESSGMSDSVACVSLNSGQVLLNDVMRFKYRYLRSYGGQGTPIANTQHFTFPVRFKAKVTFPFGTEVHFKAANLLNFRAGPLHTFQVVIPGDLVDYQDSLETFDLEIVAMDKFGNVRTSDSQTVSLSEEGGNAITDLPASVKLVNGRAIVSGLKIDTPGAEKFVKVQVSRGSVAAYSNYAWAHATAPPHRRFYGDLQFHAGGVGMPNNFQKIDGDHHGNYTSGNMDIEGYNFFPYEFARDNMLLDFAALTEHVGSSNEGGNIVEELSRSGGNWQNTSPSLEKQTQVAENYNDNGKFTTFFGYEWGGEEGVKGGGHHCLLFYNKPKKQFRAKINIFGENGDCHKNENIKNGNCYANRDELFVKHTIEQDDFIAIPHTMSWYNKNMWPEPKLLHPMWDSIDNYHRPIGEIYSMHNVRRSANNGPNQEGALDNEFGLVDESGQLTHSGWDYHTGWFKKHKIGVVGSSDNHVGTPGLFDISPSTSINHGGIAVILAKSNTRKHLWEAMTARRVYATTGSRIYLNFEYLDSQNQGNFMGTEIRTTKAPQFNIRVGGTAKLKKVVLVKMNEDTESVPGYTVPAFSETIINSDTFNQVVSVDSENKDTMYFVRVIQEGGEAAWSSPIWIQHGNPIKVNNQDPHVAKNTIEGFNDKEIEVLVKDRDGIAANHAGINDVQIALSIKPPGSKNDSFVGFTLRYDQSGPGSGFRKYSSGDYVAQPQSPDNAVILGRWGSTAGPWMLQPNSNDILNLKNKAGTTLATVNVNNVVLQRFDSAPNDGGIYETLRVAFDFHEIIKTTIEEYDLWVRVFDRFGDDDLGNGQELGMTTGWVKVRERPLESVLKKP